MVKRSCSPGVVLTVVLVLAGGSAPVQAQQQPRAAQQSCASWESCRDLAAEALAVNEFERGHDLAWRAVQLRKAQEPELMYLLARAQSLSGRPGDALVMLGRLADLGIATDADTSDEFARVRSRDGWSALAARAEGAPLRLTAAVPVDVPDATAGTASSAAGTSAERPGVVPAPVVPVRTDAAPAAPGMAPSAALPVLPVAAVVRPSLQAVEALRFAAETLVPGGFAYDGVSGRFLLGSLTGRKIEVVNERSARMDDLVRADSAGFRDLAAMTIDTRRGDLWVVSNDLAAGGATLHKLQLIAGRPLASIAAPPGIPAPRFVDLAVTPGGVVLVVDAAGGRLYRALPRATALDLVMTFEAGPPSAVTATDVEHICFVAYAGGIARVDLSRRTGVPVIAPATVPMDQVTGLWWHAGGLVTLRTPVAGERQLRRLTLDRRGMVVEAVELIDAVLPPGNAPFAATLSGDDLYLVGADEAAPDGSNGGTPVLVRRVSLGQRR